MSIFNDKTLKGVAEAAAKIMGEQLKGNQHKIDVAEPKGKITGADFAKLRTMKKEDVEQVKESGEMGAVKDTKGSVLMKHKTSGKEMNVVNSPEVIKQHKDRGYEKVSTMKKEDVEQIDELSKETLMSYKDKARNQIRSLSNKNFFHNNKFTDDDKKKLAKRLSGKRKAGDKIEDKEQIDELNKDTLKSYVSKAADSARTMPGYGTNAEKSKKTTRHAGISRATEKLAKEEVETLQEMEDMIDALIQEYESKGGVYKHKGTYGTAKGAEYGETDYDKENEMAKKKDKPARKAYGARQNYVRSTRVNEGFVSILDKYNEGGLQTLFTLVEEPDSEQFADELKKQERKAAGTAPDSEKAKVAAPATQGVKSIPEEIEQIDESDLGNGYKIKMKHIDKGRIHSPSGEHVADVTRHESGWQYHSGNSKWDGTEKSPHYKTGVEKTKMAAARKAAQIHMNEEVEQVDERQMTEPEMKEREKIVKGMKKGIAGFKQRYGERAKSVMYATATKQAMKD